MKKIICLLVMLALTSVAHAGDKKKKAPAQSHPSGGGGGGHAPSMSHGGGGGHAPSLSHGGGGGAPNFGQKSSHSSKGGGSHGGGNPMSSHSNGGQSSHGHANPMTTKHGNASSGNGHVNPMMAKHGNAAGNGHANPMTANKGNAGGKGAHNNPMMAQKNGAAGKNQKANAGTWGQSNMKGNRQAVNGRRAGVNNRGWANGHAARNYRVRPYREVYHNYHAVYHDRGWYRANYDRVILVGGGYYYWDGGYWFPAWGYDPAVTVYAYSEPVYSYDNLPPDEVVVNVQTELQDEGYYTGEVDGQMGPQTRDAVSAYQKDHDLEVTSAIDEPTVDSLGLNT